MAAAQGAEIVVQAFYYAEEQQSTQFSFTLPQNTHDSGQREDH